MSDIETVKRDIGSFTDPATAAKVSSGTSGCRFQIVRNGMDHDYFLTYSDESVVARHANNKKYLSLRSLLASSDFADMRGLASTQVRMNKEFDVDALIPPEGQIDNRPLAMQTLQRVLNPKAAQGVAGKGVSALLLDGPAGVGKTSLIQRFLVQRARAQQDSSSAPPILHVTSRGRRLSALDEALAQSLQVLRARFTFDQVPTLIRHNLIQLAVDGFDELVDPEGYKDAWYALRDFFDDTLFGGPIILAGRDTFFDEQSFARQMKESKHAGQLNHVRLGPVSVSAAKQWLAQSGWKAADLASPYSNLVLRPGSYTLRPYFLYELSKAKGWKTIESSDLTPRAYLVEKFVGREATLIAEQLSLDALDIRGSLYSIFEEVATEMADNETDVVDLSFLQMVTEFAFNDSLSSTDVAKLRHKAGSFALLASDSREGFRRFPHSEISYHFLARALIRLISNETPVRFLRRGIVASDLLAIFAEALNTTDATLAQRLIQSLERLRDQQATFDRQPENVASLLLTGLCRDLEAGPRVYNDISASDVVLFGLVAPSVLDKVRIQRLDATEASLVQVEFRECDVVNLYVDDTTRFGTTRPVVHRIHLHKANGVILELFDPTQIAEWLDSHSQQVEQLSKINQEALDLLDRVCRIMLRQHVIKDHETDASGKVLRSRYWKQIETILSDAKLIDRIRKKPMSGTSAPFVRMRDPYDLLANRVEPKVAEIWSQVGSIPK